MVKASVTIYLQTYTKPFFFCSPSFVSHVPPLNPSLRTYSMIHCPKKSFENHSGVKCWSCLQPLATTEIQESAKIWKEENKSEKKNRTSIDPQTSCQSFVTRSNFYLQIVHIFPLLINYIVYIYAHLNSPHTFYHTRISVHRNYTIHRSNFLFCN